MTTDHDPRGDQAASAEERAEQAMERVVRRGARVLGRIREELDDIVAEGRTVHESSRTRPE